MPTHRSLPTVVYLSLTLAALSAAQEGTVAQLLSNASFEEGGVGATPLHWHKSGYDGKAYPKDFPFAVESGGRTGNMAALERPAHLHCF